MLRMDQVHVVRHKCLIEKQSIRQVAREMGLHRKTVRKYLKQSEPRRVESGPRARPVLETVGPRIEELIEVAEGAASAPVYALLKRADERHLTMQAYDNPVFVEDMVRNVAVALREDRRVTWFRVRADNQESIHNHNAFAQVTWSREAEKAE